MPRDLGGQGVPDLDRFGRALRLRWLWQEWVDDAKPWVGTIVPCNDIDRLLFNSSTTVTIGNGHKAWFWHHALLEGEAPRYLAPNLFKLVRRKKEDGTPGTTQWEPDQIIAGTDHYIYTSPRVRRPMGQITKCAAAG